MNGYERMAKLIHTMSREDESEKLRLATMLDSERVKVGSLVLEREDYLKSANLTNLTKGDTIVLYKLDTTYLVLAKVV